eukprot:CAMPEP_0113573708 /NCGR_PEP_ID=MMETSP0015_2-20120614/26763_1 /TAXON_ID=2838 /ORGANISM="Odontella" /LENGTH=236 /DNA_ID=CAMNT_0000476807 /DNA_START=107 /DNA_END=817 /DNA_ORIENTATION=- /assembly_acc=CAM_ASM_000160
MRAAFRSILLRPVVVVVLVVVLLLVRRTDADAQPTLSSSASPPPAKVIELNARNFDLSMKDGSVWLVEFYAPWCGHCKRFAPTYEEVAKRLHTSPPGEGRRDGRRVMVAKVDGAADRALAARFSVHAFPTFYLVDGWDVYQYEGRRTLDDLVDFAEKDYANHEPIPFLNSPFGPMGQVRAAMMYAGTTAMGGYESLVERGYSKGAAACIVCAGGIVLGLISIIALGLFMVPKPKED